MTVGAATTACLALAAATAPLGRAALVGLEQAVGACRELSVDFIVLEGEANLLVLEDDIRADLAKIGVNVTLRELLKEDFNEAMVAGDFNMAFSETWGPPYDPHSYAASWSTPDEAYFSALNGLPPPNTKEVLDQKIADVLTIEDEAARQAGWTDILNMLHDQATELPISGKRIPAVINRRLTGYTPGQQQFDYPVHTLRVLSGGRNMTLAPGGQTGLFAGVGRLDAHSYRPNEFFANNWVYEGLVEYGPGGAILPSLAVSWIVEDLSSGGQQYTFMLRQNVTFHDGTPWDCAAAKLNFDHVLAAPLTTGDYHGWYGLPGAIDGWSCEGDHTFVVTTKSKYYPLLQELSFIRPLRMLSPAMFVAGLDSDPIAQNSCPTAWGTVAADGVNITCAGTLGISGTGRWIYEPDETVLGSVPDEEGEYPVQEVVFTRNADHWDAGSGEVVDAIRLVRYDSHEDVRSALLDGSLDAVIGDGVLEPAAVAEFMTQHLAEFQTYLTQPLQNRIVILNTAKPPTNELAVRKAIIHAVNKAAIIDKELFGLAEPADSLFPKNAPYCGIDLTPRFDYDIEKATLLNCPVSCR